MRNAALKVRHNSEDNSRAGSVQFSHALGGFAAAPLTTPTLDAVPEVFTVVSNSGWWSRLALAMLEAGMIDPDRVSGKPSAALLAQKSLDNWIYQRLGKLRFLGLKIVLADQLDAAMDIFGLDAEAVAIAREEPLLRDVGAVFFLSNMPCEWNFICIGNAVTALETAVAGLGRSIWSHMEDWMFALGLNPVTPSRTEYHVSRNEWYGEDDEECVKEELGEEFDESGIMTRAKFDSLIPPFIVKAKPVIAWKELKRLASSPTLDARAQALLGLALRCKSLMGEKERGPAVFSDKGLTCVEDFPEQLSPAVFARWSLEDPTVDAFDNMAEYYQQGGEGYYEGASGFDCLPVDDPEPLKAWMLEADRYLRCVRLLDDMLTIFQEYN